MYNSIVFFFTVCSEGTYVSNGRCVICAGVCKDGLHCNKSTGICDDGCSLHRTGTFCDGTWILEPSLEIKYMWL